MINMEKMLVCHSCGTEIALQERVGRQDTCSQCGSYLHCCRNCRFYDVASYNECREPQAERVVDKMGSNFCDYFDPNQTRTSAAVGADSAKQALEDLFKKK